MLDIKLIRTDAEQVKEALKKRGQDIDSIDRILELDEQRRKILSDVSNLKQERNQVSDEIGRPGKNSGYAGSVRQNQEDGFKN